MAHAHTYCASQLPVISNQPAPLYVVEQVDTYFWALVLAWLPRYEGGFSTRWESDVCSDLLIFTKFVKCGTLSVVCE